MGFTFKVRRVSLRPGDWRDQLWDIVLCRDGVGFAGLTGHTLEGNPLAGLLGCLLLVVGLDTVEDVRVIQMQ